MKKNKLPSQPQSGFKVPENYFHNLEERVMAETSLEKGIINPEKLKTGFEVPDNYFEELEVKVLQKVTKTQEEPGVISLFNREKLYFAAAIAAVLVFIFSTVLLKPAGDQEFTMESIEISALEEYINNGQLDFNFNEISYFLSEEDYLMDEMNVSGLSDEEVFRYLNENVENPDLMLE